MIKDFDEVLTESPDQWIETLPNYLKPTISQLIKDQTSPIAVAELWLRSSPVNTLTYCSHRGSQLYLDKVKTQLIRLLCGHPDYQQIRDEIKKKLPFSRDFLIGCVTSAIALKLSIPAALLTPLIVLLLMGFGQVHLNAFCQLHQDVLEDGGNHILQTEDKQHEDQH